MNKGFFDILFSNNGNTLLLYTLLIVFSSLFAWRAQPERYYGTLRVNKGWFGLSFLTLCFFCAFADVGEDTEWYKEHFINMNSFSKCGFGPVELGFQYYNVFLHFITKNPITYIIISRVLMVALVFWGIYMMREKSVLWLAVLGFSCVVYFQMFSALRNGLAYSSGFLAYAFCVKNKNVLALIIAILGISIHRSMAFFVIAIILYLYITKTPFAKLKKQSTFILLMVALLIYYYGTTVFGYVLASDDALMRKYDDYMEGKGTSGYMAFFVYLPLAYVFANFGRPKNIDANYYLLNVYLSIIGFVFALLAYQVGQLTRVAPYFSLPFLFFMGFYVQTGLKENRKHASSLYFFVFLIVLYWLYRYSLFVSGLFFANGLNDYKFFTFG